MVPWVVWLVGRWVGWLVDFLFSSECMTSSTGFYFLFFNLSFFLLQGKVEVGQ